jgi:hypothetical protein
MDTDTRTSGIVVLYRDTNTRAVLLIALGVLLAWLALLVARDVRLDSVKMVLLYGLAAALVLWGILRLVVKRDPLAYGLFGQGRDVVLGRCRLNMVLKYGGEFRGCRAVGETASVTQPSELTIDVAVLKARGMYSVVAVALGQRDAEGRLQPFVTVARDPKSFARFGLLFLITDGRCYGLGGNAEHVREWLLMIAAILSSAFPGVRASRRLLLYPDTANWLANTLVFGVAGAIASGAFDASKREAAEREVAEGELRDIADELGWRLETGR